ncbi:FUSC family protein [Streptomyces peucetius]|uniref:Aromatic acid exporter family protein n=1 Tax=Streptomyces peucetius TaxID=1950 RepID=A0ABY6IGJ5_STRPE|nr:aromatic acid exporter family protein [Streptomyces peucetius]UYQ66128.1 aromatic acid exporter family protein [Streptomyces peucetius]
MAWHRWVAWEGARVWTSVRRAVTEAGPERDLAVQSLKAAGAAVLAWALVGWWWKAPMALMAPWTAVVLVQSTVYRSLRAGTQQLALIGIGTLLAAGAASLTENSMAAMALALPPAVLLGNYSRFGDQGLYAPTTAIFVLAYSSFSTTAIAHRLFEALVGALIGIGVNALVLPPVHLRDVRENLDRLGRDSAQLMRTVADDVESGYDRTSAGQWHEGAQRLCGAVEGLDRARGWTRESYRFNPGHRLRRHEPPPPDDWDAYWSGIVDRLASLTGTLVDTAGEWRRLAAPPDTVLGLLTELLRAAADACDMDRAALASPPAGETRGEAMKRAWEAHGRLKGCVPDHDHETATAVGALAAQTQQLLYTLDARPGRDGPG